MGGLGQAPPQPFACFRLTHRPQSLKTFSMFIGICHNIHHDGGWAQNPRLASALCSALGLVLGLALARSPLTLPQPSSDHSFELPDVLGERMVIPPNTPDWVLFNCKDKQNSAMSKACRDQQQADDRRQ